MSTFFWPFFPKIHDFFSGIFNGGTKIAKSSKIGFPKNLQTSLLPNAPSEKHIHASIDDVSFALKYSSAETGTQFFTSADTDTLYLFN